MCMCMRTKQHRERERELKTELTIKEIILPTKLGQVPSLIFT